MIGGVSTLVGCGSCIFGVVTSFSEEQHIDDVRLGTTFIFYRLLLHALELDLLLDFSIGLFVTVVESC